MTDKQISCSYMLYDMSNAEIIAALRSEGWSVDVKKHGDAEWHPAFVGSTLYDNYRAGWEFCITKGMRQYTRSIDLYPIANRALYSDKWSGR